MSGTTITPDFEASDVHAARGMKSRYTRSEDLACAIIHGAGIFAAVVGRAVVSGFSAYNADVLGFFAVSLYGITLIAAYTASTLYHSIPVDWARPMLRKLDHVAIFLLIAGTYTPFTVLVIGGTSGWVITGAIWILAVTGLVLELTSRLRTTLQRVLLYLMMSWACVAAIGPLTRNLDAGGLWLLLGGGLSYTIGIVFYLWRSLPHSHTIWHGFVLLGSILHYMAILFYIVLR